MRKNIRRILAVLFVALISCAALCACSSGSASGYADNKGVSGGESYLSDSGYDAGDYGSSSGAASSSGSSGRSAESLTASNRKLIETVSYTLETKTFDSFITDLETQVKSLGGYTESVDARSSSASSFRYATYTVKIPTEKKEDFKAFLTDNANVLSNAVDTEDVTLKYIDVESRLKSLRLEQASLEEILKSATSVSDIIEIRDRLGDVIYEIESYEAQQRALDNDIDYTAFHLSVREVEHESSKEKDSVWQRIGSNLSKNFELAGRFFEDLFVGFVSLLPLWIALGVMGLIALLIVRICLRASRKKKEKSERDKTPPPKA